MIARRRSTFRANRLLVPSASKLDALVRIAGAAMNVRIAKGFSSGIALILLRPHPLQVSQADRQAFERVAVADVLLDEQMLDAGGFAGDEDAVPVEVPFPDFGHELRAIELDAHVLHVD